MAIKTIYEQRLYIILAIEIFIILPIIIGIILVWYLNRVTICNNTDCVLMGADTYLNQNRDISPCDDFYEYACGHYLTYYKDEGYYRKSRKLQNIYDEAERFIFKNRTNPNIPFGLRYLKEFLSQCLYDKGSESIEYQRDILSGYARYLNFPIANYKKKDFTPHMYNYEDIIVKIIKIGFNFEAFFQLYVSYPQEANTVPSLIFTAPRRHIVCDIKHTHSLFVFGAYMWMGLSEELRKNDDTAFNELVHKLFYTKNEKKFRYEKLPIYKNVTLGYILKEFPHVITKKIIEAVLPPHIKVNDDLVIYMTNNQRDWEILKNAEKILTNPNDMVKRAIQNYICYRALIYFDQFIHTSYENDEKRLKRCILSLFFDRRLQLSFNLILYYTHNTERYQKEIKKITTDIINQMRITLKRQKWLTNTEKLKAITKLDNIKIIYGVPKEYQDITALNKEPFDKFDFPTNKTLLENVIIAYKNNREYEFNQINKTDSKLWTLEGIEEPVTYIHHKNTIIISTDVMYDTYMLMELPAIFRYLFSGTLIAERLADGFGILGKLFDEKGNFNSWWSKHTTELYLKRSNCLISQYDNYSIFTETSNSSAVQKISGTDTYQENINDQVGLQLIYNTFYEYYVRNGRKVELIPAFANFTQKQLFWVLYGQMFCSSVPENEKTCRNKLDNFYAPDRFRVIGTIQNSPQFARDFRCQGGTSMNPARDKCIILDP